MDIVRTSHAETNWQVHNLLLKCCEQSFVIIFGLYATQKHIVTLTLTSARVSFYKLSFR